MLLSASNLLSLKLKHWRLIVIEIPPRSTLISPKFSQSLPDRHKHHERLQTLIHHSIMASTLPPSSSEDTGLKAVALSKLRAELEELQQTNTALTAAHDRLQDNNTSLQQAREAAA